MLAGDSEVEFLRQVLHAAGYRAPLTNDLAGLVNALPLFGWAAPSPHFAPPQPGALFVQARGDGSVARVGLVGAVHRQRAEKDAPVLRDYFLVAAEGEGRAERVEVSTVSFWLLPPG